MDDNQLTDLKQFITATVSQSEQRIKDELGGELKSEVRKIEQKIDMLRQEMNEGFAAVGESTANMNDQLADHETRITNFEPSQA
jgi:hypothetical protein